jgi:hypothetical protein
MRREESLLSKHLIAIKRRMRLQKQQRSRMKNRTVNIATRVKTKLFLEGRSGQQYQLGWIYLCGRH